MSKAAHKILFVPGIRPKPHPAEHGGQLRRSLTAGLQRVGMSAEVATDFVAGFELVAWSHGFYGEHRDISEDLPGIERLLSGVDSEAAAIAEARSMGRRMIGGLYALADYFPILGTVFSTRRMQTRVQEINRYFDDVDGEASVARGLLADALRAAWAAEQRVILMGHSFGSVIAYDTLWEMSHAGEGGEVDLFLTMGSPLTMNYINHHLKGARARGVDRYPANINRWVNLAAIGEVTALDRKLSHRFHSMLALGLVDSIEDDLALVNQFYGPAGLNVHKCYGYLASTELGRILRDWSAAAS